MTFRKYTLTDSEGVANILSIILILFAITLIYIGVTNSGKSKEEAELKNNTACQQQYNQKAYWKEIRYGRYSDEVDYCVLETGELRILRKPE